MGEFKPVETLADLHTLDLNDVVIGYMDCYRLPSSDEPGSDRSRGYWHGWRNAQRDLGLIPPDIAAERLAREYVQNGGSGISIKTCTDDA